MRFILNSVDLKNRTSVSVLAETWDSKQIHSYTHITIWDAKLAMLSKTGV